LEKPWLVYIVKCSDGTYYTGITNDLAKRIAKHNAGRGAKYTRTRRPVYLMYAKPIGSMVDALKEERRVKKLTRAEKEKLFD
jgi:predicted GIY-YIG superfamily endonuclease